MLNTAFFFPELDRKNATGEKTGDIALCGENGEDIFDGKVLGVPLGQDEDDIVNQTIVWVQLYYWRGQLDRFRQKMCETHTACLSQVCCNNGDGG